MTVKDAATDLAGFLAIDKPVGPTSHDVVAAVRRALGGVKVGHAGTLDPLASGLLILGVGSATKSLGRLVGLGKTYEVTVALGATTATDDAEATPEPWPNAAPPARREVEAALGQFLGEQTQRAPRYSAKKRAGVRLYRLARRGGEVAVAPHRVVIHDLRLVRYEYPELELVIRCSSGTYVRALARDLGASLGIGGYVRALRRTTVGPFTVADARPFSTKTLPDLKNRVWPAKTVLKLLA